MASLHVVDTTEAHLRAEWTHPEAHIFTPNERRDLTDLVSPFLVLQFQTAGHRRMNHDMTFLEEGTVRIVIAVPAGHGARQLLIWGEEIALMFRERTIDGVEYGTPDSPILEDDNDDGAYYLASVLVPYQRFTSEE